MKHKLLFIISFLFIQAKAQEYVKVIDENIVVNSMSAISGYTRNTTEVKLPDNAKSYIYRITISPKGNPDNSTPLLDILNNNGDPTVAAMSRVTEYAVKNNDNHAVDAFIFNNIYDSSDFYSKRDGNWTACKSMPNRGNCCFESSDCINNRLFFGFRNNNVSLGLNVRLEVVAYVDSSSEPKCSYTITNSTNTELKYYVSTDNLSWEESKLRSGYFVNFSKVLFFKIYTGDKFVSYRLIPGERYKFVLNKNSMWDLITY